MANAQLRYAGNCPLCGNFVLYVKEHLVIHRNVMIRKSVIIHEKEDIKENSGERRQFSSTRSRRRRSRHDAGDKRSDMNDVIEDGRGIKRCTIKHEVEQVATRRKSKVGKEVPEKTQSNAPFWCEFCAKWFSGHKRRHFVRKHPDRSYARRPPPEMPSKKKRYKVHCPVPGCQAVIKKLRQHLVRGRMHADLSLDAVDNYVNGPRLYYKERPKKTKF